MQGYIINKPSQRVSAELERHAAVYPERVFVITRIFIVFYLVDAGCHRSSIKVTDSRNAGLLDWRYSLHWGRLSSATMRLLGVLL